MNNPAANVQRITPLSLYEGDHLNRLFGKLGLGPRRPWHLLLRALLLLGVTWVPMALIAIGEGLFRPPMPMNFFADFAAYAQFFIGLPLFVLAEAFVIQATGDAGNEFYSSGVLRHEGHRQALNQLHRKVARIRDAWWIELLCVALAYQFSGWIVGVELLAHSPLENWHTRLDGSWRELTCTAVWAFFIAIPILNYWWLRHIARVLIWSWYLYRVSRLRLDLLATHPDRTGGIGFISDVQGHFAWLIFAYGVTNVAAPVGYQISVLALNPWVPSVWGPMLGFVIGAPLLFTLPLFFFTRKLAVTRQLARRRYRRLLYSETHKLEGRILPRREQKRRLPEAADVAVVNQLAQLYERVDGMRVVPFDFRSMVQLLSSSLGSVATILPLLHAEANLEDILQALVKVLEHVPFAH
jgi:hypothetical protein